MEPIADPIKPSELPKTTLPKHSLPSRCREILKEIKDLTYIVKDITAQEILEKTLKDARETFAKSAVTDSSLVVEDHKEQKIHYQKKQPTKATQEK